MRIVLSERAYADLDRLRHFLLEKDKRAAGRAVAKIAAAISSLAHFPERGHLTPLGLRELVVPRGVAESHSRLTTR